MNDPFKELGLIPPRKSQPYSVALRLHQITQEKREQHRREEINKVESKIKNLVHLYNIRQTLQACLVAASEGKNFLVIPFPVEPSSLGDPDLIKLLMSGSLNGKYLSELYGVKPVIEILRERLGIEHVTFDYNTFEIKLSW